MTQENLLSTLRAILIIVGSYVVGHNVFGHAVDASTWQIVAGAVVTLASTGWGIATKTSTIEGVESAVRSVITSVGGLFVSAGVLSGDNLNAILGLITALAPAVQSALSKSKTAQIAGGQLNAQNTGKVIKSAPKVLIILLLIMIGMSSNAQSPFKTEPKPAPRVTNRFARVVVVQSDSIINAFRFTANVAAYNYNFGYKTSSNISGAEYGYEHQKYHFADSTLRVIWSINAAWFPINTAYPITLSNLQTFGLTFGFHNPLPIGNSVIQVGPDFNPHAPKQQQWGVLATVGILLN